MQNASMQENNTNKKPMRPEDDQVIDLVALFYRLMEKIVWIILAAVIGGAIMGYYSYKMVKPTYQATSKIYIIGSDTTISVTDLQIGSFMADDYMEVFQNWHVHEMVEQRLGMNESYSTMAGSINVTNPPGTHVLYITATSRDPQLAQDMANTYAQVAREFIAAKMDMREPNIFEEARYPAGPVGNNKTRNIMLGLILGGMLATGIVTVQFLLDDRIRTEEDITKSTGLANLGMMPLLNTQELGLPDESRTKQKRRKKA